MLKWVLFGVLSPLLTRWITEKCNNPVMPCFVFYPARKMCVPQWDKEKTKLLFFFFFSSSFTQTSENHVQKKLWWFATSGLMDRARLVFIRLSRHWPPAPSTVIWNQPSGRRTVRKSTEQSWCSLHCFHYPVRRLDCAAAHSTRSYPSSATLPETCNGKEVVFTGIDGKPVQSSLRDYLCVFCFLEVWYRSHGVLSDSQKFTQRRLWLRSSAGRCAPQSSVRRDATNRSVSLLEVRGMLWPLCDI